ISGAALSRQVSENLLGMRLSDDVKDAKGNVIVKKGRKVTNLVLRELQKNEIETLSASPEDFEGALFAADVVDTESGDVLSEANVEATPEKIAKLIEAGVTEFAVVYPERDPVGIVLSET